MIIQPFADVWLVPQFTRSQRKTSPKGKYEELIEHFSIFSEMVSGAQLN